MKEVSHRFFFSFSLAHAHRICGKRFWLKLAFDIDRIGSSYVYNFIETGMVATSPEDSPRRC